jgi:hypothetical protein
MYFFDTETTGWRNWKAPVTDVANWLRVVQLPAECDDSGATVSESEWIIRPILHHSVEP